VSNSDFGERIAIRRPGRAEVEPAGD